MSKKAQTESARDKGKAGLVPKLRFPEFRDAAGWEEQPLDKFLDYIQPTPYLVADSRYSDDYETPVLTAGKTFLLGYTKEQHGIFKDGLPVIIFDDFTTATQFVDFPFKAKSSAMKILRAKNGASIKFMYETLQVISYEVGTHERHWISKFAPMQLPIPVDPKEQKKIADCLSSLDELITAQAQKVETLKAHKKGLMQLLFPTEGKTLPQLRFPEFRNAPEWHEDTLSNLINTVSPPEKLQTNAYRISGLFPIIDQSPNECAGRTDNDMALISVPLPLIIFGDHTCNLKISRHPFAQGADGIKIFYGRPDLETEYLFQYLQHDPVRMEEYKRHFSILKEKKVLFPDVKTGEQQKIADCLSSLDELITAQAQKLEALKAHKKGLMQQIFPSPVDEAGNDGANI